MGESTIARRKQYDTTYMSALQVRKGAQDLSVCGRDQLRGLVQTLLSLVRILKALFNDPELARLLLLELQLELFNVHEAASEVALAVLGVQSDRLSICTTQNVIVDSFGEIENHMQQART